METSLSSVWTTQYHVNHLKSDRRNSFIEIEKEEAKFDTDINNTPFMVFKWSLIVWNYLRLQLLTVDFISYEQRLSRLYDNVQHK